MATKHFYYICLIGITFLGGCFILLLRSRLKNNSESKGMIFMALGLFSFATIGLYKFFDPPFPELILSELDRFFSVFTNIFFVAALPFFPSAFIKFREEVGLFRKKELWINSVFIFFTFLTIIFAVINRNIESQSGKNVIIFIDSFFSTITIGLISYALYRSITNLWSDRIYKVFFGSLLTLFPISQTLLPLTILLPELFNDKYFYFLLVLLIGISFFTFTAIVYYSISNSNVESIETTSPESIQTELQISFLKIGFDDTKRVYFIELEFIENKVKTIDRIESRKLLLPFSNWVLFSVAKKLNVKLLNQDIALTKFRMVEYWNKESENKINQEMLFMNDLGLFEFNFDADSIEFENQQQLISKITILETIQKHSDNFSVLFPNQVKKKIEARDVVELLHS